MDDYAEEDENVFCIESNNDEPLDENTSKFEDVEQYIHKDRKNNCSNFCLTIIHSLKVIVIDCEATRSGVGIEWLKDFFYLLSNDDKQRIKWKRDARFFIFDME